MLQKTRLLICVAATLLLLFAAPVALAHANLVRSEPAANSAQKVPPTVVRLWFSEDIEPSFSSVSVVDKSTTRVDKGASRRMSDDTKGMEVSLNDNLPPGLYTVLWKSTSAVDGHVVAGSFSFTVGDVPLADSSPRAIISLVDTALSNSAPPPLYQVIVRWLNVLFLALLVGSFTFPLLILFPALRENPKSTVRSYVDYFRENNASTDNSAALAVWLPRWLRFTKILFVLYALVTVVTLLAQAYTVDDISNSIMPVLFGTRFGAVWVARVAGLLVVGIALFRAKLQLTANVRGNRMLWFLIALGLFLCITQSLDSHGAAVGDPPVIPLVVDLIHLLGVIIWVGGLVQMIATLPALLGAQPPPVRMRTLAATISVFSLVAFLSVGIIILSGAFSMIVQVGSLEAFFATLYGNTLFVKFILIVPLLALGALNLIVNRRAYARARADRAVSFFHRIDVVVAFEVVFAAAVLLAVGYLTSVAPAKGAYDPNSSLWIDTHKVDDLNVTLGVAPALVGPNDFDVKVQDAAGQPVSDASVVRLLGTMREMDMGTQEIPAQPQGNGHYTFHGDLLSMVGTWDIGVLVRRAGHDDSRASFTVFALNQRAPQSAFPPALLDQRGQVGLGLTLLGFAIGTASVLLLDRRRTRWTTLFGAFAVSIIGVLVLYQVTETTAAGQSVIVPVVPGFAHLQPNPVRPIPAQLAAGAQVFQQNCATCHGADGKGDGPAAANLNPKPADLTVHAPLHTDGDLYWWVTNGITGTAMPAWENRLTDLQRWQVVTYVKRTFGVGTPTPQPPAAASQSLMFFAHPASDLTVSLSVSSSGSPQTFDANFTLAEKRTAADIAGAVLELTLLDQAGSSGSVSMDLVADGHYRASGNLISQSGLWLIRLVTRRQGVELSDTFPFYYSGNGPDVPGMDLRALQSLKQSDIQMNTLTSLKSVQKLNDGKNGLVTTRYEYQAPDRLHYQVVGGIESIAIGGKQFDLNGGVWSSRPRIAPFVFPAFDDTSQANQVWFGRMDSLDGVPMQIVESTTGTTDSTVHYAFWIGMDDHLIHQYAMVGPAHFMVQTYTDFNAPLNIQTPVVGATFPTQIPS